MPPADNQASRGLVPEIYRTLFLLLAGAIIGGIVPIGGLFYAIHDQVTTAALDQATATLAEGQTANATAEHADVQDLKAQISDVNQSIGQVKQTLRDHGYHIN